MSAYPLQTLLSLRIRRADEASDNLRHLKNKLKQEISALDVLKEDLEKYRVWKLEEIDRRYIEIYETIKTQTQINEFNIGIAALSFKEDEIKNSIVLQEKAIEDLKKNIVSAEQILTEAHKGVQKIESHRELYMEQLKKELEFKEDLELEDFRMKEQIDI